MTQGTTMTTAPSSRIPMAKPRQTSVYRNGYDQPNSAPGQSKLEQMQMQYQQKLIRDKERRMNEINQQTDQRARNFGDAGGNSLVRDFFRERREMAEQGHVPNIDHHFSKKKAEATGSDYSTQYQQKRQNGYVACPPAYKSSAGRDKSNPLAPIDHGAKGQKSRKSSAASNGSYPSSYPKKQPNGVRSLPASRKTSFVGSGTTTPTGYPHHTESNGDFHRRVNGYEDENQAAVLSSRNMTPQNKKISFKEWQQKQKKSREGPATNDKYSEPLEQSPPMTDFQKWQAEQDAQRADRLQKHAKANGVSNGYHQTSPVASSRNSPNKRSSPPSKYGGSSPSNVRNQKQALLQKHINTQSKKHLYASHSTNISDQDSAEESGGEEPVDENLLRKKQELEAMIRAQQEELKKMKKQRASEEEEARKAQEREAKRVAQQRERQRRLQEAEEKERREREEQERKEREKRELDERDSQWLQEQKRGDQQAKPYDDPDPFGKKSSRYSSQGAYSDRQAAPSSRSESHHDYNPVPKKPTRVRSNHSKKRPQPPPREPSPEPEPYHDEAPVGYDVDAALEDGAYQKVDLAACRVCGRKFARDRLAKHQSACKVSNKKRKVFDTSKMRTEGTEQAKYANQRNRRPEPQKKKSSWRKQHENFIATIRYAKQVTEAENSGANLASLPPPPVTEEPDLVPCPHCKRTFNPTTAERHIPRCKDIKTRPAPFRTNRK